MYIVFGKQEAEEVLGKKYVKDPIMGSDLDLGFFELMDEIFGRHNRSNANCQRIFFSESFRLAFDNQFFRIH